VVHIREAFVAFDTSKLRNAVAIAESGRDGEVRYLGEIDNTESGTRKLVASLEKQYQRLTFCYEAGPTGYGLYRLIKSLGQECIVIAPSMIPVRPGERIKTNRRDAVNLSETNSSLPPIPVKGTVLDRLGDMVGEDVFTGRQVGDRTGDFDNLVVRAGRKGKLFDGGFKEGLALFN